MAIVYRVDPLKPQKDILKAAAEIIRQGGLVAFPTETVYGLGADAFNTDAVKKIFKVKGRPADNPLIVHVSSSDHIDILARDVPEEAYRLIDKAWPGPLTIVLRKRAEVPKVTTGGLDKVAVRCPAHPVALKLIDEAGTPIAAPSANRSGKPSPTRAEHVLRDLGGSIDAILDGGEVFFGVESTIIDLTTDPPTLLRPGPIDVDFLEKAIGRIDIPSFARGFGSADRALSPGTKYRHYAPDRALILIDTVDPIPRAIKVARSFIGEGLRICVLGPKEYSRYFEPLGVAYLSYGSIDNLYEVARNLYSKLREIDQLDIDLCIALPVEERGIGLAIMNRLRKASSRIVR